MPRLQYPWLLPAPATCFCGRYFDSTIDMGRHLRACPVWKTMSPAEKKEHKDRTHYLNVLRSHNPERGRFKFCMMELRGEFKPKNAS